MSGRAAAERAASVDRPKVVWSKVQDVLNKAYGALESNPDKSIRALQVYHHIQNAMFKGVSFVRNEKGLKEAIAELERIKAEEIPVMVVPQKTRRFNNDWRQAMEVPNMWNSVMGTAQAALARTETRGSHIRSDFPKIDNENWLKNVFVSVKDGVWTTEARPVVASMITADQIPAMIVNIGFEKSGE
jgi:succinate dehydrogenase/fumarate reductase flavoprotein subunit